MIFLLAIAGAVAAVGILVMFAVGFALMRIARSRYRFKAGIVRGVVGELGGGKSAFVVDKVLVPAAAAIASEQGLWCEDSGRTVKRIITNFHFDPTVYGIDIAAYGGEIIRVEPLRGQDIWEVIWSHAEPDPDDPDSYRIDAVVAIDEMSLFAPSDKLKMGDRAKGFAVHSRHLNCELWWIAQDPMQVHKRLRDLSQGVWYCRRADRGLAVFLPGQWHQASRYRPADVARIGSVLEPAPIDRRTFKLTPQLRSAYNSFETIIFDPDQAAPLEARRQQHEQQLQMEE